MPFRKIAAALGLSAAAVLLTSCAVVTVPVKVAGTVVTTGVKTAGTVVQTGVKTTGAIVSAPFNGDSDDDKDKEDGN